MGPEWRGPQSLEDPAFTVNRDDRDERQHSIERDQHDHQHGHVRADEVARASARRHAPAHQAAERDEQHDGHDDRAQQSQRLARKDLDLEPGQIPESAHVAPILESIFEFTLDSIFEFTLE